MRKNLAKLVRHINMLNLHVTEDSPEYKILDPRLTDEMIDVALAMKLRTTYSAEEVAKRAKRPLGETKKILDQLTDVGLLEYKGDNYAMPIFFPGSFELMVMKDDIYNIDTSIAQEFQNYSDNISTMIGSMVPQGHSLGMILPIQQAIQADPKHVDAEEISYYLDRHDPSLALTVCQCRRMAKTKGTLGTDDELEWCIMLGEFAESCIRTGRARRVTKQEVYDVIAKAEELGYMHVMTTYDGPKSSFFICNCNYESCIVNRFYRYVNAPDLIRSNYVAQVDPKKCVACGRCVEVCPMNTVRLGQKICQKDPVEVKDDITPYDHIWTKKNWNTEYLYNRENVVKETGTAPCKTNCPAHIAIQGYLKMAGEGRYDEALELIKKENPFPAVCGKICNRRCEASCTLGTISDPVAIDDVKMFIAKKEMEAEHRYVPKKMFDTGEKVAVIGAGPAGLSCAYYLAIYGDEVTVFEKNADVGGMLRYGIPSFRLEKEIIDAEIDVIRQLGVTFKTGVEVGKDITLDELRAQGFKGFYVAIGAQGGRMLGVEGEDAEGVVSGVDFLREVNEGNAPELNGRTVVIGGGNVAIDVARTAVRCNSDSVSMYCLESRDIMPAADDEVEEAEAENITINNGWGPKRILTENGKVKGIEFKRCTSVFDSNHRFAPTYDENDVVMVECEHILLSVGQSILWNDLLKGTSAQFNPNNTCKADSFTYQTNQPDVFVGGDCYSGPKFAIDAIAAGKQGAVSLHRYTHEGHHLTVGRDRRIFKEIDKDNLIIESYDRPPRQVAKPVSHEINFADNRGILCEEQIKAESERCLSCGAARVDQGHCIGCGACTTRCKFDAISLTKVYDNYGITYEQVPFAAAGNEVKRLGRIAIRTAKEAMAKK